MKTRTGRSSQVIWIAATIGFAWAFLLATPSTGSAQWTVSPSPTPTNNIYYNAGNVGIGTNAPDQKLVVSANSATTLPASVGTINLFGPDSSAVYMVVNGFAAQAGLLIRRANTTAASPSALQATDFIGFFGAAGYGSTGYLGTRARVGFYASENWTDSANGTYMAFNTTANGAATAGGTERMRIDNTGNVGIGTATPTAILHIQGSGTSSYRGIQVQNSFTDATTKGAIAIIGARKTNANVPFSGFGTWDQGTFRSVYIGGGQWSIPDATVIKFYTASTYDESNGGSGNQRMLIDSSGNVGIGTTSPGQKLDVAGIVQSSFGIGTSFGATDYAKYGQAYLLNT